MHTKTFMKGVSAVMLALCMAGTVISATTEEQAAAEALYSLGLFRGTDIGYELDKGVTRAEAVTMVVRFLGEEENAITTVCTHPFTDVPAWADPYVGYAYEHEITMGISDTLFDPQTPVTESQFLTFMLRVLGYDDANGDFVWNEAQTLAAQVGMIGDMAADGFDRGDMVTVCGNTLLLSYKDSEGTLYDSLIEKGVFTKEQFGTEYPNMEEQPEEKPTETHSGSAGTSSPTHTSKDKKKPKEDTPPEQQETSETPQVPDKESQTPAAEPDATDTEPQIPAAEQQTENAAGLTVQSSSAHPGETVELAVSVENNPGILAMIGSLTYDEEVLTLTNVRNGEAFEGLLVMTPSKNLGSGMRFVWDGIDVPVEDVRNGTILVLTFEVSESAKDGEYPVAFGVSADDTIDNRLNYVDVSVSDGCVSVVKE